MFTGEDIETGWAKLNHIQYSTREMDAGARIDTITIHMLEINNEKVQRMGKNIRILNNSQNDVFRKSHCKLQPIAKHIECV